MISLSAAWTIARAADTDNSSPAAPPDINALKRVTARYGAEIVGPPIAPIGPQNSAELR